MKLLSRRYRLPVRSGQRSTLGWPTTRAAAVAVSRPLWPTAEQGETLRWSSRRRVADSKPTRLLVSLRRLHCPRGLGLIHYYCLPPTSVGSQLAVAVDRSRFLICPLLSGEGPRRGSPWTANQLQFQKARLTLEGVKINWALWSLNPPPGGGRGVAPA